MNNQTTRYQNRLAGYEIFRIFACFGIVWFHLGVPGAIIGYGGLPYFMIITVYFLMINDNRKSAKYIFNRIMVPWIFWSFVYTLFIIAKSYILHENPAGKFFLWMAATGTSLHLWYLPFSFVTSLLVLKIKKRIEVKDNPLFWAAVCSATSVIASYLGKNLNHTIPLSQYIFIIPSVFISIYFAKAFKHPVKDLLFKNGFILLILSFILIRVCGIDSISIPYIVAICGFVIAGYIRVPTGKNIRLISDATFGIYLVHLLTSSILAFTGIPKKSWILLFLAFILSFVIVRIIKITPLKRFV